MKKIVFFVAAVLTLTASIADPKGPSTVKCSGGEWDYYYELYIEKAKIKCKIISQVNRLTGKNSNPEPNQTGCWESLARIQLDGADCCFTKPALDFYEPRNKLCK